MKNTVLINKLPVNTWNKLCVNSAPIEWDNENTVCPEKILKELNPGENSPLRLSANGGDNDFAKQEFEISAQPGSFGTVFEHCFSEKALKVENTFRLSENSHVKLVLLLETAQNALLVHDLKVECGKNAVFELTTLLLGDGNAYSDNLVQLCGDKSGIVTEVGYIGKNSQLIDYNIAVNHFGKDTNSEITASGALMDSAKKTFRGTIDFKNGSSGSVGSENETVLMLGDDVVNKTVPLILCAEENVEGTHGATIGELDEATLFYFESRGIDKDTAQNIMARASAEKLIREMNDEEFEKLSYKALSRLIDVRQEEE